MLERQHVGQINNTLISYLWKRCFSTESKHIRTFLEPTIIVHKVIRQHLSQRSFCTDTNTALVTKPFKKIASEPDHCGAELVWSLLQAYKKLQSYKHYTYSSSKKIYSATALNFN